MSGDSTLRKIGYLRVRKNVGILKQIRKAGCWIKIKVYVIKVQENRNSQNYCVICLPNPDPQIIAIFGRCSVRCIR